MVHNYYILFGRYGNLVLLCNVGRVHLGHTYIPYIKFNPPRKISFSPPMTCRKNPEAIEKEARIRAALATVISGKHNCNSASLAFNVSRQMLYDRMNGKLPRQLVQAKQQVLSHVEEKELVRWITRLTITGYPPQHKTLLEMVEEIRKQRICEINDQAGIYIEY